MTAKTLHRPFLTAVFGALVLGASFTAIAATPEGTRLKSQYMVSAEILVDGKTVSSPRLLVRADETASIEMDSKSPASSLRMTLIAKDFANATISDGIDLNVTIDYKTPTQKLQAKPRIIILPGAEGSVTVGTASSGTLEVRVIAERQ